MEVRDMGRPSLSADGSRSTTISVAIPPLLRQTYEALAVEANTTISTVLRQALQDWVRGRTRHTTDLGVGNPEDAPCPHCRHRRRFHLDIAGCEVTKRDGTICPCTWGMVGDEEETA
jgi:hypothetical protein